MILLVLLAVVATLAVLDATSGAALSPRRYHPHSSRAPWAPMVAPPLPSVTVDRPGPARAPRDRRTTAARGQRQVPRS